MEINTTTEYNQSSSIETNEIPADINHYGFRRVFTGKDPYEMYVSEYIKDTSVKFEVYKQISPRGEHTAFYSIEAVDGSKLSDEKGELMRKHIDSVARFPVEDNIDPHSIIYEINRKCDNWVNKCLYNLLNKDGWNKKLVRRLEEERIRYIENRRRLIKKILSEHKDGEVTIVSVRDKQIEDPKCVNLHGTLVLDELDKNQIIVHGYGIHIDDIESFTPISENNDKFGIYLKNNCL